jgi:DNA-directed RNA polymerase subunit RPC12/RpoP
VGDNLQTTDMTVFECTNCGGNLEFQPGAGSMACPYCGTTNELPNNAQPEIYEELDYRKAVADLESAAGTVEVQTVVCSGCGAEVTLEPNTSTAECVYCGTQTVSKGGSRKALKPQYILPFSIPRQEATRRFRKWIASRRFAPSALKQYARISDPLKGIYYPFWTFDSSTRSEYRGQRGVFYTEQIRTTNREGKSVTRTVTKTRWYPARGTVTRDFDDVLVPASHSLEDDLIRKAQDYPLRELVAYDSQYLSGFHGETYSVEITDGFADAKTTMDGQIRVDVRRDIGGDTQRITSLHTVFSGVTFKYIVLPVYALKFKFRNRFFPVIINGVTGEVAGKRPFSWIKITLAALVAVAVIVGGYFLLRYLGVLS